MGYLAPADLERKCAQAPEPSNSVLLCMLMRAACMGNLYTGMFTHACMSCPIQSRRDCMHEHSHLTSHECRCLVGLIFTRCLRCAVCSLVLGGLWVPMRVCAVRFLEILSDLKYGHADNIHACRQPPHRPRRQHTNSDGL